MIDIVISVAFVATSALWFMLGWRAGYRRGQNDLLVLRAVADTEGDGK